ncbi:MAG: hypothetical protein HOO88_03290 [Kiritimatiellaceae bacterium]|nr:hypothetical protein [Kiritimatiellaceae bacterium]
MNAQASRKRLWRRDPPIPNPYRDTLSQEIGYKLDARYAGCLLIALATGVLMVSGGSFVVYWLLH